MCDIILVGILFIGVIMESPVLKLKKKKAPNLILLTKCKTIQEEDVEVHFRWEIIDKWYRDTANHPDCEWIDKALTSTINSIVYQQRTAFALTAEVTREMLNSDKNWERVGAKPIGLKEKNYKLLIGRLVEAGIVEEVYREHKKPIVFRVINEDILNMIKIDNSGQQLDETLNFVKNGSENVIKSQQNQTVEREGQREGQKGSVKGKAEGKGDRELEGKPSETESQPQKKGGIPFEAFLYKFVDNTNFPRFDDLPSLAQHAVETCEDLDDPAGYERAKFEKHISANVVKPSKKQKDLITNLGERFIDECQKYINLVKYADVELVEPQKVQTTTLREEVDKEQIAQENTVATLKGTFVTDTLNVLKKKLDKAETQEEKDELQLEITMIERML